MSVAQSNIRLVTEQDADAVHGIYAPVGRDTVISFEWEVPTVQEIRGRIGKVLSDGYPWLVAEVDGRVSGYAYAGLFRTRTAYSWTVEVSVYVDPQHHGRGVGRAVYGTLLRVLELQGYRSAYGVATAPNPGSEGMHRSLGFEQVGRFPRVGYKFGRWHDVICWRIGLGNDEAAPEQLRPVADVLREGGFSRSVGVVG